MVATVVAVCWAVFVRFIATPLLQRLLYRLLLDARLETVLLTNGTSARLPTARDHRPPAIAAIRMLQHYFLVLATYDAGDVGRLICRSKRALVTIPLNARKDARHHRNSW